MAPRTLFVIINAQRVEVSEPHTTLFHDQWFIKEGFTDENMARRFIDMHVRGYYDGQGKLYFYRSPTFIFDDQDTDVMLENLPKLLEQLLVKGLISKGQQLKVYGGRGHNAQLVKTVTV